MPSTIKIFISVSASTSKIVSLPNICLLSELSFPSPPFQGLSHEMDLAFADVYG